MSWPAGASPICRETKTELPVLYPGFWQVGAALRAAAGLAYLEQYSW